MQQYLRIFIILAIAAFLAVMPVSGEENSSLTIDELLHMENIYDFSLSPDGNNLVSLIYEGSGLRPDSINITIRFNDLRSGQEHQLSGDFETPLSFALSPLGTQVAYSPVPKDGEDAVLKVVSLVDLNVTVFQNVSPGLPEGFSWLGEDELIYTETVSGVGEGTKTAGYDDDDDTILVDEQPHPEILKKYSLKTGITVSLTSNDDVITRYVPSPDGNYILYKSTANPDVWQNPPVYRYVLLNTSTGEERSVFNCTEGGNDENAIVWAPDSSAVYIERFQYGGMAFPMLYTSDVLVYSPEEQKIGEVPLNWEKGLHIDRFNAHVEITPYNGGFYALLANGTNPILAMYRQTPTGWNRQMLSGTHEGNIFALESSANGTKIVYNANSASTSPQLFAANVADGRITDEVQITDLNAEVLSRIKGSSEVIHWTGALGDDIEGVIRYPPDYIKGEVYPLVLVIHGGPAYNDFDSWRDTWEFPYHLITDMGAVALSVNYHGSLNYGFDFAESIENGHYYDLPALDLLSGKEYLAGQGIIDPTRAGSTGWSNGGILALELITRDPSLKAAVCGAGTAEFSAMVAGTDGIIMAKRYFGDTPFGNPDFFRDILPIYGAKNVKTPLLMMSGTEDDDVVTSSAMVTYRTFKEHSSAPVEFLLFPGESHHFEEYVHQYRKVQEELNWLEMYLFS